jgi:hypothetical protein
MGAGLKAFFAGTEQVEQALREGMATHFSVLHITPCVALLFRLFCPFLGYFYLIMVASKHPFKEVVSIT